MRPKYLSGLFCARDGSGNPLRNGVEQRLQRTARPSLRKMSRLRKMF